jgi:hypothetical protein
MMYLPHSDIETTLLPFFLFILYSAIVIWARTESVEREYVEPEPEPEPKPNFDHDCLGSFHVEETSTDELRFPQDFVLSVPLPCVDQALSTALSNQFELEVLSRQLSSTSNHFTREAVNFLIDECELPKAELQALAEELDKVSPPIIIPTLKSKHRSKENSNENI